MSLLLLIFLCSAGPASSQPPWHGLDAGPHTVGFRRLTAPAGAAVWYPARRGGAPMRLRDYYGATADGFAQFMEGVGIPRAEIDRALLLPMAARQNAAPASGSFPVIAIAQGNAHDVPDQAVLAEYLAAHGYVVVTTPSPMLAEPMTAEEQVGPFAEGQAEDLRRAIAAVEASMPGADANRLGVIGHSFGARAALLLAMRDRRVRALVSLDGGIGTAVGIDSLRGAPSFDLQRGNAPILHLYQAADPRVVPDFTFLETLPAVRVTRRIEGLMHVHFTTLGFLAGQSRAIASASGGGSATRGAVIEAAREARRFVDSHLSRRRNLPDVESK